MRIALLTELFPPSIGGQEVRFAELANALASRGHSVKVLCIEHLRDLPEQEQLASGVTVIRRPFVPNYRQVHGSFLPRSLKGMVAYAFAVRRLLREEKFDAVFLSQWPLLHALALPRHVRQRAVIDWCEIRGTRIYNLFQNLLPRIVAANTAVSNDVKQHIAQRSRGPVLMLPSGIARERYYSAPAGERAGLLYLGRIAHHKGVPMLIAAFEALCASGFTEDLTIAGGGPALPEVEALVKASPVASRIRLAGLVSEEEKLRLMAHAKVLVLPSQREGFPRVVAEAMASGLPTVTTRYPGNGTVTVVEEFGCGLCADPTAANVADAIRAVYADWAHFSEQSMRGAVKLDWSSVVIEFEQFLRQVLEQAPPPRTLEQPGRDIQVGHVGRK